MNLVAGPARRASRLEGHPVEGLLGVAYPAVLSVTHPVGDGIVELVEQLGPCPLWQPVQGFDNLIGDQEAVVHSS